MRLRSVSSDTEFPAEGKIVIHSKRLCCLLLTCFVVRLILYNSAFRLCTIVAADEEWEGWHQLGDPVMRVDSRDWADVAVFAPLSAHTLAKLANGLCDDTLSCVIRAWDYGRGATAGKSIVIAPAMNTAMSEHPLTQMQLMTMQGFWNAEQSFAK